MPIINLSLATSGETLGNAADSAVAESAKVQKIIDQFNQLHLSVNAKFPLKGIKEIIIGILTTPKSTEDGRKKLQDLLDKYREVIDVHMESVKQPILDELNKQLKVHLKARDIKESDWEKYANLLFSTAAVRFLMQGNYLQEILKNSIEVLPLALLTQANFTEVPFDVAVTCQHGNVSASVRDFGSGFPASLVDQGKEHPYLDKLKSKSSKQQNATGSLGGANRGLRDAALQMDGFKGGSLTISNSNDPRGGAVVKFNAPLNSVMKSKSELMDDRFIPTNTVASQELTEAMDALAPSQVLAAKDKMNDKASTASDDNEASIEIMPAEEVDANTETTFSEEDSASEPPASTTQVTEEFKKKLKRKLPEPEPDSDLSSGRTFD